MLWLLHKLNYPKNRQWFTNICLLLVFATAFTADRWPALATIALCLAFAITGAEVYLLYLFYNWKGGGSVSDFLLERVREKVRK